MTEENTDKKSNEKQFQAVIERWSSIVVTKSLEATGFPTFQRRLDGKVANFIDPIINKAIKYNLDAMSLEPIRDLQYANKLAEQVVEFTDCFPESDK